MSRDQKQQSSKRTGITGVQRLESVQRPAETGSLGDFCELCHRVLGHAGDISRIDLLHEVLTATLRSSECDAALCWVREGESFLACDLSREDSDNLAWTVEYLPSPENLSAAPRVSAAQALADLFLDVGFGHLSLAESDVEDHEAIWVRDTSKPFRFSSLLDGTERCYDLSLGSRFGAIAYLILKDDGQDIGFIALACREPAHLDQSRVEILSLIGRILGMALENQSAQSQLRERIKELQCLYEVVHLGEKPGATIDEVLSGVVKLLPPAWQYTDITAARICFDGRVFETRDFAQGLQNMTSNIVVGGRQRGEIVVSYTEDRPILHEGPFLREERHLIDALAREISGLIERYLAREEKRGLEEQLRHADRLATIGQLGAGVAHELNEPLANILGFAQLAKKAESLSEQTIKDLGNIEAASLHAREVIKKLLIFSRQMPSRKMQVDLNQLVTESASFFENRCREEGIEIKLIVERELPEITADAGQLYQVLVNLVMNAVQAMPEGGRLTLKTLSSGDRVSIIVEDGGIGMTEEVKEQLFVPFFTTKDVDQGTGLGLAVVHGIVSSHGGTIEVKSELGRGTMVEVELPIGDAETGDR